MSNLTLIHNVVTHHIAAAHQERGIWAITDEGRVAVERETPLTVISADFMPADTELDAMEINLLDVGTTDCDSVIPEAVEIEDADGCDATVFEGSRVIETLLCRTETESATGTAGLDVRGVGLTIERGRTSKVIVGATRPTRARCRSRVTTSTARMPRCAAGSGWCRRTT